MLAKEYQGGDQFFTERDLSEKFHVSRATANKALTGLVSAGLLEFRQGLGTFVRRAVMEYDLRSLVSFTEKARAAGKRPKTELLSFRKLSAGQLDASARAALALADDAWVWELHRVRRADKIPVILERRYVVHRHCPRLTKAQAEGSLYRAWTEVHGLQIAGANGVIRAVALTVDEARSLRVAPKAPALEVVAVGFLRNRSPLWWERTLYHGEHYEFRSRLGPISSATPAQGVLR